jgi:hypothetical protein
MALSTYADLTTAITNWAAREDADFASRVPEFVRLAEARFDRELRCREQTAQQTGTLTGGTLAIPSTLVEPVLFRLDSVSPEKPLAYINPEMAYGAGYSTTGTPRFYTVIGQEFRIFPLPDDDYTYVLDFYRSIPSLESNTTNWLFTKSPDTYLFASLTEAAAYLVNDERVALWATRAQACIDSLNASAQRAKRGSGPLQQRVA